MLLLSMLTISLYLAVGYLSFQLMALTDRRGEVHALLDAIQQRQAAALLVFAVYVATWPVLTVVGWVLTKRRIVR